MNKKQDISTKQIRISSKVRIGLILAGSILVILVLIDIFVVGRIKYTVSYIRCNEKPVLVDYNPLNSTPLIYYVLPTQIEDYDISSRDEYFCSEQEAIDAGYRQSPLAL